jgi:putative hemolysin
MDIINTESYSQPLQIDINKILNDRLKKKNRIPKFAIRILERILHQDGFNTILKNAFPNAGSNFSDSVLKQLNISINIVGQENIPSSGRFIFASNHPLGGLDGITLIKVMGDIYGDDNIRFLVNDLLMNVRPLRNVFLPINKYGAQAKEGAAIINSAYESDKQIIIFPAGLVSRLQPQGIYDLTWQKAFVSKAIEYDRQIIPIHFNGYNSMRFYRFAKWRKKSGIKVNIEQALLPAEVFKSANKSFTITFGKPIDPKLYRNEGLTPPQIAEKIKETVYSL